MKGFTNGGAGRRGVPAIRSPCPPRASPYRRAMARLAVETYNEVQMRMGDPATHRLRFFPLATGAPVLAGYEDAGEWAAFVP